MASESRARSWPNSPSKLPISSNLRMEDFYAMMKNMKSKFHEETAEKELTLILEDFSSNRIRSPQVFHRVYELFGDHEDLIMQFLRCVQGEKIAGYSRDFATVVELLSLPDEQSIDLKFKHPDGIKMSEKIKDLEAQYLQDKLSMRQMFTEVSALVKEDTDVMDELEMYVPDLVTELILYLSELESLKELAAVVAASRASTMA